MVKLQTLQNEESIRMGMALIGRMLLSERLTPLLRIPLRESGIAPGLGVHLGEVEEVGPGQGLAIDLGTAGDDAAA